MKVALITILLLHGLIHLMGFTKAFGYAEIPALKQPIGRPAGVAWLLACVLLLLAAALLTASWRPWWSVALVGVVLSQALVFSAWSDAKFGTVANLLVLVPVLLGAWELRPASFRSTYEREVAARLKEPRDERLISEADLARLPPLLQTYLRRVGVVGQPRVHDYRVKWRGEFRQGRDASWMNFTAEQHNFVDPPARYFLIQSSLYGVPFEGLHRYAGAEATMKIRAASLVQLADAKGEKMNQSETVTLFNDMCLLAPATLVDAPVVWQTVGERTLLGTFTNGGNTISAELYFDVAGDLVNFVSNDRYQSADGKTYLSFPWTTPVAGYRQFKQARVAASAEARWEEPLGGWVYGRFELVELEYNVGHPAKQPLPAALRHRAEVRAPVMSLR